MSPAPPKTVLIVDDEADLVETLAMRLGSADGLRVEKAYDGQEGLDKARAVVPAVILLDIQMPRMDGWQFCRGLREDPKTRDIPVLIMTAWLSDSLKRQAREAGATRVLLKPLDEKELVGAIQSAARRPL